MLRHQEMKSEDGNKQTRISAAHEHMSELLNHFDKVAQKVSGPAVKKRAHKAPSCWGRWDTAPQLQLPES